MAIEPSTNSPAGNALANAIASALGSDPAQTSKAIRLLTDELGARVQRKMLSRGGVADVTALVTSPSLNDIPRDAAKLTSSGAEAKGNEILDVLIGSKHVSRGIAGRTASQSGLDTETVKRLLPMAASMLVGALNRQAMPAISKLVSNTPALAADMGGGLLPLPGEAPSGGGSGGDDRPAAPKRGPIDAGQPLPIPGDNIPGIGRSQTRYDRRGDRQNEPRYDPRDDQGPDDQGGDDQGGDDQGPDGGPDQQPGDNPFNRLPDIIRRGGTAAPGGGSIEDVIRNIFGNLLGGNRGVIGTMIQLFLVRWIASFIRTMLGRVFSGR